MAQVDFTNAHIEPYGNNPIYIETDVGLNGVNFYNASGNAITSLTRTVTKNESDNLVYTYSGTFHASGTEFFMRGNNSYDVKWRVYNISFSNGDTFNFKISANII